MDLVLLTTRSALAAVFTAPALAQPDVANRLIRLAAFRPRLTVVGFWNPNCRACEEMLDQFKAWDANPPPDAPTRLVVVEGTAQSHGASELRATVVLDLTLDAGRAFGAQTVLSAILIDGDGHAASQLVKGPSAVMALLSGRSVPI